MYGINYINLVWSKALAFIRFFDLIWKTLSKYVHSWILRITDLKYSNIIASLSLIVAT